jgi:hypothetical protein
MAYAVSTAWVTVSSMFWEFSMNASDDGGENKPISGARGNRCRPASADFHAALRPLSSSRITRHNGPHAIHSLPR